MPATLGPRRHHEKVILNVYDLGNSNEYLYPIGLGTYHSGVQVHGKEWTFASQAGVFNHAPKGAQGAVFRQSIVLGTTQMSSSEVTSLVATMRPDWPGKQYHVIRKNCNSFASALSKQILGTDIPAWVNRMADLGNMCSCLIPDDVGGQAPVDAGGPGAAPAAANRGFQTIAPRRGGLSGSASTPASKPAAKAFAGGGARLGGGGSSGGSGGGWAASTSLWGGGDQASATSQDKPSAAEVASRRERLRAAALARMGGDSDS